MRKPVFHASRLGALLLAVLMTFTLLPAGALAADTAETFVGDEESLRQAVESGAYDTVLLSNSIELSAPLEISGELTLDLNGNQISAKHDPEKTDAPLATIILKKDARLTVAGDNGSEIAPPVLPEGCTEKSYGIYVNEKAALTLSGSVRVKTTDDTSYMVFLLSETVFILKDKAQIAGGLFGVKIPSGTEIRKMSIIADGSITSGSAISKTGILFADIVGADCLVTADGETVTDLNTAPDPGVKKYIFVPGGAPTPTAAPTAAPTEAPTAEPSEEPTAAPSEKPTPAPSEEPTAAPSEEPTAAPSEEPTAAPSEEPTPAPTEKPTAEPTAEPSAEPTAKPDLPATTNMSWDGTLAMWRAVPGASGYRVQLYLNGKGADNKLGDPVTVNDTAYDFASSMTADGSYYFTVQAFADGIDGTVSAFSKANVIDKAPPEISSRAPVRHDAKKATFYFTSSEAGDYYFILTAANSAAPSPQSIIVNTSAHHGACTAEEQPIVLNGITDSSAKNIFLVVVDRAGNASNTYRITIPAYTAPTAKPSPTPSPTPTPKPTSKPKTYTVYAPNGTGYSIVLVSNSQTTVNAGDSFSFTVSIQNGYTYGSNYAVKANDTVLTAANGVYTIKNIKANQTVTVTGVVLASTPVPTAIPSSPSISTTLLPSATMGKTYSQQLVASGGTPITWSYTGSLPNGITLSYGGLLSGTPTEEGSFRITIKAANTTGSATRTMTLVVTSADYAVTEGANANWVRGTRDGLTFSGSGEGDFTVRVDGSVVPADMVSFSADKKTVTIDAAYLETLSAGSHTLTLLYSDGNAKARFNIKSAERITPPAITAQPQNTSARPGSDAVFTVTSGGTSPLQCMWQVDKNDGTGWQDIPDAVSASYTVKGASPEQNGWKFRCVITNAAGSAESNAAVLTVSESGAADTEPEAPQKTKNTGRLILFALLGVGVVGLGTGAYLFFRRKDDLFDDEDDE